MDIELFAFCLMRNHFHLLVRRNDTHLHHFMKLLNTRYAVYFNHEYGCTKCEALRSVRCEVIKTVRGTRCDVRSGKRNTPVAGKSIFRLFY
ncbi:transposase [bacterium]|nr:transposase [bacterium]